MQAVDLVRQRRRHRFLLQGEAGFVGQSHRVGQIGFGRFQIVLRLRQEQLASARLTLAKLTSKCDFSLLSASAVIWSDHQLPRLNGLLRHLQDGLRPQHGEVGARRLPAGSRARASR